MGQSELGAYTDDEDDRPAEAEAAAVAGDGPDAGVESSNKRFEAVEETVELALMQVDYTIEGTGDEEYPVIHVFGRTPAQELVHVRVLAFRPYFYAPADTVTEARLAEYPRITGYETTDDNDQRYESIRGTHLWRIYGQTPRDVGRIRDEFDHYEADILFPNRFLIDKDITGGIRVPAREIGHGEGDELTLRVHHEEVEAVDVSVEPRVNTFDIEVDDRSGFPEDGEETIICLASHDSYDDEYILWLYDPPAGTDPPSQLDGYDPILNDDEQTRELETEIRTFETEERMLAAFLDYIDTTDPDVLTGWNFTDFDAPYLLDRLDELDGDTEHDLDANRLSRVDEVWRSDWQGPDIKGRIAFDLLYAYQRTKFTELDSYRLEDVGQRELGIGKERYAGDIGDLWEQNPERLLEYNLRDVELCVELDREQDIIAFWNEVRQFVGCKLEDATTPGDTVDMYVLHKLHDTFALPSKGKQEGEEYEGGAVFDPITGVRENVSVLDLKSLYPMCMVTINASPETKVDPELYDGETYRAPNGTRFRKQPDGVIREMVDELLTEREDKKTLRDEHDPKEQEYDQYDRQQQAVKVIMNCFTPDTEVVTPQGVRDIRELTVGDEVYSVDPETMQLEIKPVVETHSYPDYEGELVAMETNTVDLSVTPNHRMLVRDADSTDGWSFIEAGALDDETEYEIPHDWDGPEGERLDRVELTRWIEEYELWDQPGAQFDPGEEIDTDLDTELNADEFLELLAWYVSSGTVSSSESVATGESRVESAATILRQDAIADGGSAGSEGRAGTPAQRPIGALLDQLEIEYSVVDRSYRLHSDLLAALFEALCGGTPSEKQMPDFIFELSTAQKESFLETVVGADGQGSWQYSTTSERLRDDLLRLCAHLGLTASYSEDSGCWVVQAPENGKTALRMDRDASRRRADDGVYCVTVADNHTLLAGRNGTFQFVGQSLYGVLGWNRFRLYDREMGAAVTATGRDVIEFTEEVTADMDKSVTYGDTDSVMISLGEDLSTEAAIERSFELEERINDAYDEFALEELNAAEHRFQIEFEKLYRRFFQAGKKKRYAGHIVWKEGKEVDDIDITGFEYQRSDIAPITKEVQHRVIEMIVTGDDREEIKSYVHGVIEEFQNGEIDPEEIGIPGGIGKRLDNYDTDTAQVRGAKYANMLLGTNFQRGSKPKRLYLDRVHSDFFEHIEKSEGLSTAEDPLYGEFRRNPDVICFEYADQVPAEFEIDWEKMLDKTLKGPIARILEALDISWDEVKAGQEQTGLGEFM